MKNIFTLIIAVVFVLIGQVVAQTAGTLNLNFGTDGKYIFDKDNMDLYQDVKVQTDGKIVAIGKFASEQKTGHPTSVKLLIILPWVESDK